MSKPIFREASLERLSTPDQLDQIMRVTTPTAWLAVVALVVVVIGGVVWGVLGTVPIKVSGKGILISPGGVLDVVSSIQGRVIDFVVQPGGRITQGQVVAHVDQPDIRNELESTRAELADTVNQYTKIKEFHARDMATHKALFEKRHTGLGLRQSFLNDRLKWLQERESYEAELRQKGFIDRRRVIDTKIEINTVYESLAMVQNDMRQLEMDESTLAIQKEREVLELELKVSTLTRKNSILEERLARNSTVVSPYAGIIAEFKVNAGEMVDPGKALFTLTSPWQTVIKEGGELIATLFVLPEDGKKIKPGMEAQIAPSTVKREEFGFIMGKVLQVATIPSSEEGMLRLLKNRALVQGLSGGGAPFEVTVELKRDPGSSTGLMWSSSRGPDVEINSGTLCDGTLTVREVRLISLAIPALEQLFSH
ncbi:NHLP bacteriocin system secretion protein [uncultured Gammaproteobacteria bacterium]